METISKKQLLNLIIGVNNYITTNYDKLLTKKTIKYNGLELSAFKLGSVFGLNESCGARIKMVYQENIIKACIFTILLRYPELQFIVNEKDRGQWTYLDPGTSISYKAKQIQKLYRI